MSYTIVTDTSANLPWETLERLGVEELPFTYFVEGEPRTCLRIEEFDGRAYYDGIRRGARVTTAQVNPQSYLDGLRPLLAAGRDVLYVGMSSGISGSFASARMAAAELREEFPARQLRLVDTRGASLGEGLLVLRAAACRDRGLGLDDTETELLTMARRMCQVFTVDDLLHLRRSGRISNISALAGTVLQIKPLLKGDELGRIVSFGKVRGRRHAVETLAARYEALAAEPETQLVGIAHADCPAEAERLAELLRRGRAPREILTVCYEPVTGAHVGPGALALFFLGDEGARTAI